MADGGFKWNLKQRAAKAVIALGKIHTLLIGGSRSGKTFLIIWCIVYRALREPNSKHCVLRLRANAAFATIWLDTLPKVLRLCLPGYEVTPHRLDGYLEFANGSQIWIGGLDDAARVEKILGHEFATMFFNECSQIPYDSVVTALTRLAALCTKIKTRAFYDINPPSKGHWTYKLFILGIDPITRKPVDKDDYAHAVINPRDNIENIDPNYLKLLESMPPRQRKRFLEGVYADDVAGALWTPEILDAQTLSSSDTLPNFTRVVIAVDPSGTKGNEESRSDEVGIVVAGKVGSGEKATATVLADLSGNHGPELWGGIVATAFKDYNADCVVGEANYGGDMVRAIIHGKNKSIPYKAVTATRGKVVRAEPVSALYHAKRVFHAHRFDELEAQLYGFTTNGFIGEHSPDRADAAVWALTELLLTDAGDGLLDFMREHALTK